MIVIIIIIIIPMSVYMMQSLWWSRCDSSPGSFDELTINARRPSTVRSSQATWLLTPHSLSPFIVITQPESRDWFCLPVEGARLSASNTFGGRGPPEFIGGEVYCTPYKCFPDSWKGRREKGRVMKGNISIVVDVLMSLLTSCQPRC